MGASNVCWGIEIGSGAIKAIKLIADGDELKVADFAVINHPKVLSTPELDQEDALRLSLGTLVSQYDLSGASIAVSFPGHQSFARFAKLPPVEPKKVPDIVKFEAVQQIPFPLEDVEWDFQTFASEDSPEIEVGIFAITKQRIMERLAMMSELGMTPDCATLSPVAAYNALASDLGFTENTPGTIILDIGTTATDLMIAEHGRVWVRTFPIGGHQFTDALVNTFKLTYPKAEKLKREAEQTKHARHVFQAMRPIFADLVQEVQRSIGFYQSVHKDAKLERLIGLGSTFKLPGLRKYLKQQLQLDVYRMEQFKKLSVDGPRAGEFQAATLNLVTAYGCALQGLDQAPLRANLMPVPVVREAMWKRKVPWFAAAAGVAAAAGGAMFIRPLIDSTAFRGADQPRVITRVVSEATTLKNEAEAAQVVDSVEERLDASMVIGLQGDKSLYADILRDVSEMLEFSDATAQRMAPDVPVLEAIGDRPVFSVYQLKAEFEAPGAETASDENVFSDFAMDPRDDRDWMQDDRGGPGGFGGFGDDEEEDDSVEASVSEKRRVRVEMIVDSIVPERLDFMLDSIGQWLLDNAEREGVEYTLAFEDEPWDVAPIARRAPKAQAGRGLYVPDPSLYSDDRSFFDDGSSDDGSDTRPTRSLDQLAKLPDPPEPEFQPTASYKVIWWVVLETETTEEEEGDE